MYVCVAALVTAIVVANIYATLHAWRSERLLWAAVILALFLTGVGGGVATAFYLILHHHEPMPRSASSDRRALA